MNLHLPRTDHYRLVQALDGFDVVNRKGHRLRAGLAFELAVREMEALEERYRKAAAVSTSRFVDLAFK